jgi:hypothetical protein
MPSLLAAGLTSLLSQLPGLKQAPFDAREIQVSPFFSFSNRDTSASGSGNLLLLCKTLLRSFALSRPRAACLPVRKQCPDSGPTPRFGNAKFLNPSADVKRP